MTPSSAKPGQTGCRGRRATARGPRSVHVPRSLHLPRPADAPRRVHAAGVLVVILSLTVGITGGLTGCTRADTSPVTTNAAKTADEADTTADRTGDPVDPPLHPAFSLTRAALVELTEDLPDAYGAAIRDAPERFLEVLAPVLEADPELLALVDKDHLLPEDYEPEDLVPLTTYSDRLTLNKEDLSLRAVMLPDLLAMVEAAGTEGITLDISSSYRSYAYQKWLFGYWVEELGLEEAERVSARPGSSQHQLGTTVDFGSVTGAFARHPAGIWLADNAWRFGFSLSYPDGYEALTGYAYEPWHFRWITPAATALEREFFGGIQQVMLEFLADHGAALRRAYSG